MRNTSSNPRSSNSTRYAAPAVPIPSTWQDDADEEEWSAWVDEKDSNLTNETQDDDEFGAWVDSADSPPTLDFHPPMTTSTNTLHRVPSPFAATVPRQVRMNDSRRIEDWPRSNPEQASAILNNDMSGLYLNPWNDHSPSNESNILPLEDDEYEIDAEIDSALAISAWESILSSNHQISNESDDEDDAFDAWEEAEETIYHNWTPTDQAIYNSTASVEDILPSRSEHQWQQGLAENFSSREGRVGRLTDRRPANWMQKLRGKPS